MFQARKHPTTTPCASRPARAQSLVAHRTTPSGVADHSLSLPNASAATPPKLDQPAHVANDRNKTEAARARYARYRQRRRERIGEEADKARARAATKKSSAKHGARIRERRRQTAARNAARLKKLGREFSHEEYLCGIRTVTANEIRHDRTRWQGPGMYREIELEKQADKLLADAERKAAP